MAPGGIEPPHAASKAAALSAELRGPAAVGADRLRVTDGTRTHNHRDHNPGLYQLSYGHLAPDRISAARRRSGATLGPTSRPCAPPRQLEHLLVVRPQARPRRDRPASLLEELAEEADGVLVHPERVGTRPPCR